jgi:hypothetical protein
MPRGSRKNDESPVSFFSFQDVMMCTIGITIITTLILILQLGRSAAAAVPLRKPGQVPEEERELLRLEAAHRQMSEDLAELELSRDTDAERKLAADAISLHVTADELARLRSEIEADAARLKLLVDERRADDRAAIALELMEQRDRLQEQLRELNNRRRIVYLVAPSDSLLPLVTEVSGSRVVISTDQSREAPMALPLTDPEAAARGIIEMLLSLPDRDRRYLLLVLKPSGIPTYLHLRAMLAADPATRDIRIGLDLIAEDCWTTDEFPAGQGPKSAGAP